MRAGVWILAVGLGLLGCSGASAAPGLAGKVYAPLVKPGWELELRGGRLAGGPEDGDTAAIAEIGYGFSRRFSLSLLTEIEDAPGADRKLGSIGIEGVGYLGTVLGIDAGIYLEYEQRLHNESGKGEAKLLLERDLGPVHSRLNLIAEHAFTNQPGEGGTEFGYAASAMVTAIRGIELGAEGFGDLGTNRHFGGSQEHYVGPAVRVILKSNRVREIELRGAYLLPAGAAAHKSDGQIHLELEIEF